MARRSGSRSICKATGKKIYPSYFEARDATAVLRGQGEDHGDPYRCEHCGGFHLGRRTR